MSHLKATSTVPRRGTRASVSMVTLLAALVAGCGGGGEGDDMEVGMNSGGACIARNLYTGQVTGVAEYSDPNFILAFAYANFDTAGQPYIVYGPRYYGLSSVNRNFTRHHECAHVSVPTADEVRANCVALLTMRRRGLSSAEESEIANWHISMGAIGAQYGGTGAVFWQATLTCAGS